MIRSGWVVCGALVACLLSGPAVLAQQGATGLGGGQEELKAASEIKGLSFGLLDKLPRAPKTRDRMPEFCSSYAAQPRTPGGHMARSLGWLITGEAVLGSFTAVSFAGSFEPATSGTCIIRDGNVGLFNRAGDLVALAYAAKGSNVSLGRVEEVEGAVNVRDGEPPHSPVARIDLQSGGYLLRLGALAAQEKVCGGRAVVPNIRNQTIDKARRALIEAGWTPVPGDPANAGREADLRKRGVPEVDGCSGTGFGYCSFNYKGPAGKLDVTTIGDSDFPTVSDYSVQCS